MERENLLTLKLFVAASFMAEIRDAAVQLINLGYNPTGGSP